MKRTEQQIHVAVVEHLRMRGKRGLLFWHTPQGAHYSSRAQGGIMKGLGGLAGVSDLLLMHAGRFFALELKAPKGKPTGAQLAFLKAFWENGGHAEYADSLDGAIKTLENWGLLKGKVQ
jgi:hypothetical protein